MARNETGVMLRVRPETADALRAALARREEARQKGADVDTGPHDALTTDQMVRFLVRHYEATRRRRREAGRRRAAAKREAQMAQTYVPTAYVQWPDGRWGRHPFNPEYQSGKVVSDDVR